MTITSARPQPAPTPVRRGRRWRWLRLAVPFLVVAVIVTVTLVAHSASESDPADPSFLSPISDAPDGGTRLAQALVGRGVRVERETVTSDALVSAYTGDATLLITTPSLVHPYYLRMLKLLPASTRVVLVAPDANALEGGHIPLAAGRTRWATATLSPGCDYPPASGAGDAEVGRHYFGQIGDAIALPVARCYANAMVSLRWGQAEIVAVGASEPFRNDRIAFHGNAALSAGLLSGHPRVVWLDLHHREAIPGYDASADPNAVAAPPSLGPGPPDQDFPLPGGSAPGDTGNTGQPNGSRGPGSGDGGGGGRAGSQAVEDSFPSWTAALILEFALAAVLLAWWRGRRLGSPVPEPLPVSVPAAETVAGRGRLYRRAHARDTAAGTLRMAARDRLRDALGLERNVSQQSLVAAVANQAGAPADVVDGLLFGIPPEDDAQLLALAANLDSLVHHIVHKGES